jgi:hypothetical protein
MPPQAAGVAHGKDRSGTDNGAAGIVDRRALSRRSAAEIRARRAVRLELMTTSQAG